MAQCCDRCNGFDMFFNVRIVTTGAVNDGGKDILLGINKVKFCIFHIELSAQCFDYRINEICIFVCFLFIWCSNERNFNEMLKIF